MLSSPTMLDDLSTSNSASSSESSLLDEDEIPHPPEHEEPEIIQGRMPCWCTRCKGLWWGKHIYALCMNKNLAIMRWTGQRLLHLPRYYSITLPNGLHYAMERVWKYGVTNDLFLALNTYLKNLDPIWSHGIGCLRLLHPPLKAYVAHLPLLLLMSIVLDNQDPSLRGPELLGLGGNMTQWLQPTKK